MPDPVQNAFRRGSRRIHGAFTLVELLVVLVIMAVIFALAVPAISSIQGAYSLDETSQGLQAQLNLARQNAMALNHPVEVRFYLTPDYNSSTMVYRAMQAFLDGDSSVTPLSKPYFFPRPARVFQGTVSGVNVSSLLTTATSGINVVASNDPANPLPPPIGTNYQYSYFRFRSNGMTDLSTTTSNNFLLTLGLENVPVTSTGLPANYVTLELNALSGIVDVYRP